VFAWQYFFSSAFVTDPSPSLSTAAKSAMISAGAEVAQSDGKVDILQCYVFVAFW
jgi:hypothetical protein